MIVRLDTLIIIYDLIFSFDVDHDVRLFRSFWVMDGWQMQYNSI